MRALVAVLVCAVVPAWAGQLDVAVIQFPGLRDRAQLAEAFARVELAAITDADHTRTREEILQRGAVLFAQSFAASPGTAFSTVTRIGNDKAEVDGKLGRGTVSLEVILSEGVQAGLRNFQRRQYSGSGPLPAGRPTILSIRETHQKGPRVVRGMSTIETESWMTVVVAHYRP